MVSVRYSSAVLASTEDFCHDSHDRMIVAYGQSTVFLLLASLIISPCAAFAFTPKQAPLCKPPKNKLRTEK